MILPSIPALIAVNPLVMARPLHPSSVSLSSASIQKTVQELLLPYKITIAKIEDSPDHLHRIYRISLSNGSRLILKLPPPPNTLLLRHERSYLGNEACALSVLEQTDLPCPKIVKYDKKSTRLGSPFLLTTHRPGTSYSDAVPYLTKSERKGIETQIRTASLTVRQCTASAFGPGGLVAAKKGFRTWREGFTFMMESVLMDGEDMMINLPYSIIREAVASCGESLDEVREARLTVAGFGSPENVLIERRTNEFTCLLDFSQVIWGDPGFAEPDLCGGERGLLYAVYHSVVVIVTNHYRPQRNAKELDARKRLTSTLAQLAVEDF